MTNDHNCECSVCAERWAPREQAIEECAALMQRWADEAAEFLDHSANCRLQANLCRNAAVAIRNLARPQSK